MMLANEIISDIAKDKRFKEALEQMAANPLSEIGSPTVSTTFTAALDAGLKTVRVSIEMIDEGEMFADDLSN
jgi:hypothetical protein